MNIPPGIDRRIAKDGTVSYRVRIRHKGQPVISKTFKQLTHAKRWKRITDSDVEKGKYLHHARGETQTLSKTIQRYIAEILPHKPKDAHNVKRHLVRWNHELGRLTLSQITPSHIAKIRDKLLSETTVRHTQRSPSTVVRYIASLSHLFSICIHEWGYLKTNPVSSIKKPKNVQGRTRFLSKEEISVLLANCKKSKCRFLFTIVLLALQTGMRQGEILSLTWADVDFANHWVFLKHTKNNQHRTVPISKQIQTLLQSHRNHQPNSFLVFPSPQDVAKPIDFRSAWRVALKRSSIKDLVFHDLRHTTASHLAIEGYGFGQIAEILGHKSLQMTKRYAHLSQTKKKEMLKTMELLSDV